VHAIHLRALYIATENVNETLSFLPVNSGNSPKTQSSMWLVNVTLLNWHSSKAVWSRM